MAHLLLHPLLRPLVEALRPHGRRGHRPVLRPSVGRLRGPRGRRRRRRRGRGLRVRVGHRTGLVHLQVQKVLNTNIRSRLAKQDYIPENELLCMLFELSPDSKLPSSFGCKILQIILYFSKYHSYLARRGWGRPRLAHRSIGR